MKKKALGLIVVILVIGLMAACSGKSGSSSAAPAAPSGPVAPSGTYSLTGFESWTITFGQGTFTMFVPADVAPSGTDTTANGTFTVSGNTVTLNGLGQQMSFTITNSTTLTESDGSIWKASATSSVAAKVTINVANNSSFPVNVAVYNQANISGGQLDDFIDIKQVNNGQSGSFALDAGSYGVVVARDAQTVWMYPQSGQAPGVTAMSGTVNLRFTGTEIVQ